MLFPVFTWGLAQIMFEQKSLRTHTIGQSVCQSQQEAGLWRTHRCQCRRKERCKQQLFLNSTMESRHSRLHLFTPTREKSSSMDRDFCDSGLTSGRNKGLKCTRNYFKESLDEFSDIDRLLERGAISSSTNQSIEKTSESQSCRKKAKDSVSDFKMPSLNPLKARRRNRNQPMSNLEKDLCEIQHKISTKWNPKKKKDPSNPQLKSALKSSLFAKSPFSTSGRDKEEQIDPQLDHAMSCVTKHSPGAAVGQRSLQEMENSIKQMASLGILDQIVKVEEILRGVNITISDLSKEEGEFSHFTKNIFKTPSVYDCMEMNKDAGFKQPVDDEEVLSQNSKLALNIDKGEILSNCYQQAKALRRPQTQTLPVNPFPTASSSPIAPEHHSTTDTCVFELENDTDINTEWTNWMQEYGHIYIEASSHTESHEDLLDSDEALRRLEEEWSQEMEPSLSLSNPSRPQLVDFLHLTALDKEDISPVPSPLPPLSRRLESEDAEDKTPGRLQAVWPPLQEEEKVGLKYTEAEHQASLLQLKRECNEDLEKLQEDYAEELSRLKEESDDSVSRLQFTIIELQSRLSQSESRRHGDVRDASVSTNDETKTFRNACIQTDHDLMKPSDNEDGGPDSDFRFFSENWSGQNKDQGFSDHRSLTCQTQSIVDPVSRVSHCLHSNVPPPPPGPPPPPPPLPESGPGIHTLPLDTAPRKPSIEPSRPMKPLYWARIQLQQNNEQTVWSGLEEAMINTCDFEDLFCKTSTQTKRRPLSEGYGRKTKTKKIVKLLEQKRSQAVGILISSLHLDMKDIERAVLTVDPSVVDVDTIEALYENKAQPDELGKIKQHYETSNEEDVKLLDKPEQFLFELSQIPDFSGRAQCIIFQSSFLDGIVSIRHKLRTVSSVCEDLSQRQSVKQVMGLVLALGNHMNGGSRTRGQADGFGLDILPKLKDVKSRDNRINLGDYVVSYYLQNVDKNAGTDRSVFPLPEPQDVFLAAQVKFEELHKDLRQLCHDLTQCEKNIQNVCSNSPEEHLQPFKDKMEAFVLSARKEHAEASYQLQTIEKSFQDLVAYFGLQAKAGGKEVTPGYFFMLWFEFCADFKVRWKRESKNFSKERLKEAQLSVKRITGEKKVETRKTNANSLKERLRQKEVTLSST